MARSYKSIYAALAANVVIATAKFIVAGLSRSAAMASEAIHSLVDCLNELLLLFGIHRSNKKSDKQHPFGYGRELYFWSFIVALVILAFGAGVAFFVGYQHLRHPTLNDNLKWNFMVLGISLIFDGGSLLIALRAFNKNRDGQSLWTAVRRSKDPSSFMIVLEDGASVAGILLVAVCLFLGKIFHNPYFDGIASLGVGILLAFISIVLALESRSLLMGEGISSDTEQAIIAIVKKDGSIDRFHRLFSIYLSPEEVLLVLIVSFRQHLETLEINEAIERIKKTISGQFERISYIIIQPQAKEKMGDGFSL